MKIKRLTESFQQREIIEILGVKRQRWEYLQNKLYLTPTEPAEGVGGVHYYDWLIILESSIGHILNLWGFSFLKIREILLKELRKHKEFYSYRDYSVYDWRKNPGDALIFYSKILTNGRDGLETNENTYFQDYVIARYKEIFKNSDNMHEFLNEKGIFVLNLDRLKDYITKRIEDLIEKRDKEKQRNK